jgi:hypothetical protein
VVYEESEMLVQNINGNFEARYVKCGENLNARNDLGRNVGEKKREREKGGERKQRGKITEIF